MNQQLLNLFEQSKIKNHIDHELYKKYNVKKGLRNEDGTGVLIGLTRIADVVGYIRDEMGNKINCEGDLIYREIPIKEVCETALKDHRLGYEKVCFLLLFGHFPSDNEFDVFMNELNSYQLPDGFLANNILAHPSSNLMNMLQSLLLQLYCTDELAEDTSPENTLRCGLSILSRFPALMCYSWQSKAHFIEGNSLIIHSVNHQLSMAENILHLLSQDGSVDEKEAELLDLLLILHADHGSGNNSTFSNLVVASTGTDLYSATAASIGSLKGPKHGGANITCRHMMMEIMDEIGCDASDDVIEQMIERLLQKDYFDHSGLIYGFGHAVYTLSDPRCEILKQKAYQLALSKGNLAEFHFYQRFETKVKERFIHDQRRSICANVDFYSGLVYEMLGIPEDLVTPLFACSRMVGWLAHNIEEKLYSNRIIRPAGKFIKEKGD
ncbi:MAG: citrate synthase [Erysipelotrichaceae bacterium]|nr:citrate synthase [Erysipelotrichaceae bacterium]